jgi:hypothetical protein
MSASLIAISGKEGKLRLFEPETLQHAGTLPRPHALPSNGTDKSKRYPDALAVVLSPDNSQLAVLFNTISVPF